MSVQHQSMAQGRWASMAFLEQMANIGSEVERALTWSSKGNTDYTRRAVDRALELFDFSLMDSRNVPRLRELAREREALVDYFLGCNEYGSSESALRKYYGAFAYAARRDR